MIRILVVLMMVAGVANARPSAPALYDVYDVIAPDTLNVRGGPGGSFPDIGDLSAHATRIEVVSLDESGKWGMIRWNEGLGWVSMRYMSERRLETINGQMIQGGMMCAGTEPFWALHFMHDGAVVLDEMGMGSSNYDLLWSGTSINLAYGPIGFVATSKAGQMTGNLTAEYCSDGMSELPFGYRVDLILNDHKGASMISGCCSLSGN